jgi:hypothetical protein
MSWKQLAFFLGGAIGSFLIVEAIIWKVILR